MQASQVLEVDVTRARNANAVRTFPGTRSARRWRTKKRWFDETVARLLAPLAEARVGASYSADHRQVAGHPVALSQYFAIMESASGSMHHVAKNIVVYELVDEDRIYPVTAFEVPEP